MRLSQAKGRPCATQAERGPSPLYQVSNSGCGETPSLCLCPTGCLGNFLALYDPPKNPLSHIYMARLPPRWCPGLPAVLRVLPGAESPPSPPLHPQKQGPGAPTCPSAPGQRCPSGAAQQHLTPAPALRPWSPPRKNTTSGRGATGVTLSGKKEGFALTCGAWVCNQSTQAGFRLDCTLAPRQAMGRILVCTSAAQTPAPQLPAALGS